MGAMSQTVPNEAEGRFSRRRFLRGTIRGGIGLGALTLGSMAYGATVEPGWLAIENIHLKLSRLSPKFGGLRVAQISDIHMDAWMTRQRLSQVVEVINAQKPDVVAITGDFVTNQPEKWEDDLVSALQNLEPREVSVAVLGNHDHWTDGRVIRRVLRRSGIVDVCNAVHTLRRGDEEFHLCGVDDFWERKADLNRVLESLPKTGAAMLLAHEPDFADLSSKTGRFDLQISGHSHGGQVQIPFRGPIHVPKFAQNYPNGLYRVGEMWQYTNRGLGMVGPHVRFCCRPEITIFTLSS
jgi:uncharacterized protein